MQASRPLGEPLGPAGADYHIPGANQQVQEPSTAATV